MLLGGAHLGALVTRAPTLGASTCLVVSKTALESLHPLMIQVFYQFDWGPVCSDSKLKKAAVKISQNFKTGFKHEIDPLAPCS